MLYIPVFQAHALLAHALLPDPVLGNGVTAGVVPLFVGLLRRLRGLLSPFGWDTVVVVLAGETIGKKANQIIFLRNRLPQHFTAS